MEAIRRSPIIRAITILLLGVAAFDLMGVVVRLLGEEFPILQISVLRNFFGIIPALILLLLGPDLSAIKRVKGPTSWKIILIRSAAILFAQMAY